MSAIKNGIKELHCKESFSFFLNLEKGSKEVLHITTWS